MKPGPALVGPRVVAIFGPTASGKTEVAIRLAELLAEAGESSVAINCDSIQVYRSMEVLSGAPTGVQREALEHRLVAFRAPTEEFSAGEFGALARSEIDRALADGIWPILVGGTGLYMRSALTDLDLGPELPDQVRNSIEEEMERLGPEALHRRLPEEIAKWVEPTDRKRIARYLGLQQIGERPAPPTVKGGRLWDAPYRRPTLAVGLVLERKVLRERISNRIEMMVAGGAIEESRRLLRSGPSRTAGKAIGLREFAEGDIESAARGHLRLARRQMTWLRRSPGLFVIDRTDRDDSSVAAAIFARLEKTGDRDA